MIQLLFEQLSNIRDSIHVPLILMGYINPALQFGFDNFLEQAKNVGIDGVIIPDLPMYEYENIYKQSFEKNGLENIFLITPQTANERILKIDSISNSFIYVVSSHTITGTNVNIEEQQKDYFERLKTLKLKNPTVIGFGIKDASTFKFATLHANGAIIGSAYIKQMENSKNIQNDTNDFVKSILAN